VDFKTKVVEAIAMPESSKAFELVTYALEQIQQKQFSEYDSLGLLLENLWEVENLMDFWEGITGDLTELIEQTLNGVSGGVTGFGLGENPLDDSKFLEVLFKIVLKHPGDDGLLCIVANNPYCPPDYLREIAKSEGGWEENSPQETVARNTGCPEDLLRELSECPAPQVRFEVAGNSSCPADILEKLSHDVGFASSIDYGDHGTLEESLVLFAVLGNPNCPIEILERISLGDFGDLRIDEEWCGSDYLGGDEGLEDTKVVFRAQATKALALRS
jgi:hypothetical protein